MRAASPTSSSTTPPTIPPTIIERYVGSVVTHPWTVIALSAVLVFTSIGFVPSMGGDTRADAGIKPESPALVYRDKVEELGGLATVVFQYKPNPGQGQAVIANTL